ncbi:ATP-binding protein [Humitalea sp. 24SJ18S-53]|uniref:ATP-binding protein n=1 Tax=Humitalea sp. 24SJ18S-53 TaxID=3422307 RepID=UPI003D666570
MRAAASTIASTRPAMPPAVNGFRVLDAMRPAAEAGPAFRATGPETAAEGLREIFTPTRPRALGPLFIGREVELKRLIAAIEEERAHVVLYGDRGRGKTSLANAFADLATEAGVLTVRRACGADTGYERLFRGLLSAVPPRLLDPGATGHAATLLPDGPFGPEDVADALARVRGGQVLFLIDEFDRAESPALRNAMAETIKNLSDQALPVTLLLVGVAGSLDDLLGHQPSIQRNLVAIHVPPMRDLEVARLVTAGAAAAGLAFAPDAAAQVVRLARGMPYYAHLLCLFAARAASARKAREVTVNDVTAAIAEAVRKQEPELGGVYERAMALPGAAAVLRAAAEAPRDADDRFAETALPPVAAPILAALARPAFGPALVVESTPGGLRYAFALPALAHHMLFRAALSAAPPTAPAATDAGAPA